MKKIIFAVAALFAVATISAKNYSIWVNGTQVTDQNAASIAQGASYDPASNVLTLTQFNSYNNQTCLETNQNLNLLLKGSSNMSSKNHTIRVGEGCTLHIMGDSLYMQTSNNEYSNFHLDKNAKLEIFEVARLYLENSISGTPNNQDLPSDTILITSSWINIREGIRLRSLAEFAYSGDLALTAGSGAEPQNPTFSYEYGTLLNNRPDVAPGTPATKVFCTPRMRVGGYNVAYSHYNDVLRDGEGKVRYNERTNTLSFNQVDVEGEFFVKGNLKIKIQGECSFHANTGHTCMFQDGDSIVLSGGTLNVRSNGNNQGIRAIDNLLVINGITLDVEGSPAFASESKIVMRNCVIDDTLDPAVIYNEEKMRFVYADPELDYLKPTHVRLLSTVNPEGIPSVSTDAKIQKRIVNGQVVILRDGHYFTLMGTAL